MGFDFQGFICSKHLRISYYSNRQGGRGHRMEVVFEKKRYVQSTRFANASLMPKPYSYDLRKKVIEAIELDGLKKSQVSQLFNISRNTIDFWLKRKAETGDYQALPNQPPGNNHQITDWKKFREFAVVNGDKTQVEMARDLERRN